MTARTPGARTSTASRSCSSHGPGRLGLGRDSLAAGGSRQSLSIGGDRDGDILSAAGHFGRGRAGSPVRRLTFRMGPAGRRRRRARALLPVSAAAAAPASTWSGTTSTCWAGTGPDSPQRRVQLAFGALTAPARATRRRVGDGLGGDHSRCAPAVRRRLFRCARGGPLRQVDGRSVARLGQERGLKASASSWLGPTLQLPGRSWSRRPRRSRAARA